MSKEKQQASQKCPKCEPASPATEDLSEYEKECSPEELEALEKKAAAMYGFDLEGDRRLDAEFRERRRKLRDRYHGALLGLAAGDALGTTLEFKTPGTFKPLSDMVGGGPFNLQPGQWTDDTSMALCLGESLVQCHGFDPRASAWSSTNSCQRAMAASGWATNSICIRSFSKSSSKRRRQERQVFRVGVRESYRDQRLVGFQMGARIV
jgi:ADP-ribosylglycohydrolase